MSTPTPTLSPDQRKRVTGAIERALREVHPRELEPEAFHRAGGVAELYAKVDELVQIVRRSTSQRIEPYLAEILEDVCAKCVRQDPSGFCPLRHEGRCVLYANASAILEAIAGALREMHDEPYQAVHAPIEPTVVPAKAGALSAARAPGAFRRILIAANTDDASRSAIALGLELSGRVDAQVALVHVLPPVEGIMDQSTAEARQAYEADRRRAEEMFRQVRAQVEGRVDTIQHLPAGYPAEQIIAMARGWEADVIVIGAYGNGVPSEYMLGSTAQAVIRSAPCPVLVVRPQTATAEFKRSDGSMH